MPANDTWCNIKVAYGAMYRCPGAPAENTNAPAEYAWPVHTVTTGTGDDANSANKAMASNKLPPDEWTTTGKYAWPDATMAWI